MMNESDGQNPTLAVCPCSHCSGHLEFDASHAGETVQCPHCGKETVLFSPVENQSPDKSRRMIDARERLLVNTALLEAKRLSLPPPTSPAHFEKFSWRARNLVLCGWILFVLAFIVFAFGFIADTTDYAGKPDPGKIQEMATVRAGALSAIGFSIFLIISGWIIEILAWIAWRNKALPNLH